MGDGWTYLIATAALVGGLHTLIGPDHWLPFLAIARAREWSLARALAITNSCGIGHLLGSIALGTVGIALGWTVASLARLEAVRGELAAWMLLGFGLAYTAWGLRRALRNRPHTHRHWHADGSAHRHEHRHFAHHAHVHAAGVGDGATPSTRSVTPWVLFVIFVFGPCEALIPLLMFPAAAGSWWTLVLVCLAFGLSTVGTMAVLVGLGHRGLNRLAFGRLERFSHALAGLTVVGCAVAIRLGV